MFVEAGKILYVDLIKRQTNALSNAFAPIVDGAENTEASQELNTLDLLGEIIENLEFMDFIE